MNKAAEFSARLERLSVQEGLREIESLAAKALQSDVIDDTMCIMHDDGSVNFIENRGTGVVTVEVISAASVLKVLQHYRPFPDAFTAPGH